MQEKHHQDKVNCNLKMSSFLPPPFCCTFNLRTFKDLTSFHVKKGLKWLNYILLLLKLTTTIVTLDDSYLLSVAKKAIISAAILQQSAERLCEDEHLVLTRWPLVFFTTEGSSESEKNQIWKKRKKNALRSRVLRRGYLITFFTNLSNRSKWRIAR